MTLQDLNYQLFQAINNLASHFSLVDQFMIFCAEYLIFAFLLIALLQWGRPLNWHKQPPQADAALFMQERRATILWTLVACVFAFAFNTLLAHLFPEPRPFVSHVVKQLVPHAADNAFPSDHTAWSFALVGMFALLVLPAFGRPRPTGPTRHHLRLPFILLVISTLMACAIGVSRIYVGVHYPGDVLFGAVDGMLAAVVVTFLRHLLRKPTYVVLNLARAMKL